ncbi:hypothetical protein Mapa_006832 [Marchantia paleacea]|nr:hypothetical protein Mapa_006832 [Marchantia paleacea]
MTCVQERRLSVESDQDTEVAITETTTVTETIVVETTEPQSTDMGVSCHTDLSERPPGPISIAEVLENVADTIGDKPVTVSDARAIQSAEALATGISSGVKGGPGSIALSAVDQKKSNSNSNQTDVTIGDVLKSASSHLIQDKIVTSRDASKVHSAEARNNNGQVPKGGVSSTMQQAAAYNHNAGYFIGMDENFQ